MRGTIGAVSFIDDLDFFRMLKTERRDDERLGLRGFGSSWVTLGGKGVDAERRGLGLEDGERMETLAKPTTVGIPNDENLTCCGIVSIR